MEKVKISHSPKIKPLNSKEKVGDKIESLWGENLTSNKNSKYETKKLIIKLETGGKEKRKILLKLESGSPKVHNTNYNLISELLKGFFNGS
ncbi:MAG: hypothetical protein ACFFDN_36285 [Candidatus Hodarchaeota archaeon]